MGHRKLEVKKIGELHVPVKGQQIASVISWLQSVDDVVDQSQCPIDLDIFPESMPSYDLAVEGSIYFSFQRILTKDSTVTFVYDRNLIKSGIPANSYSAEILRNDLEDSVSIDRGSKSKILKDVERILLSDFNTVISRSALTKLAYEHEQLRDVEDPKIFVGLLEEMKVLECIVEEGSDSYGS